MADSLTAGQLISYAEKAGFNADQAVIMAAIALAESGGIINAVGGPNSNGTYDYGTWQINSSHTQFDRSRLLSDPQYNADAAYAIFKQQGYQAWSTYNNGAYKNWLYIVQSSVKNVLLQLSDTVKSLLHSFYALPITQAFGNAYSAEPGGIHKGVDLGAPSGTSIPSLASGKVITVYNSCTPNSGAIGNMCGGGFGNYVALKTNNGYTVFFAHMRQTSVHVGDNVTLGQIVGISDNTGNTSGPHTHIEIRDSSGTPIDPTPYINAAKTGNGSVLDKLSAGGSSALSNIVSEVGNVVDDVTGGITDAATFFTSIGHIFAWFSNSDNWPKILMLGFGVVFAFVGLKEMVSGSQQVKLVQQTGNIAAAPIKKTHKLAKTAAKVALLA